MNEEQKKGKMQVLIMFVLILIASFSPFARKIFTGNTENFDFSQLGALFMYPLLMIFTYKGNRTAKAILSAFLFFAVVITVVFFFLSGLRKTEFSLGDSSDIVVLLIVATVNMASVYLLNQNKNIRSFLDYQSAR